MLCSWLNNTFFSQIIEILIDYEMDVPAQTRTSGAKVAASSKVRYKRRRVGKCNIRLQLVGT